MADLGFFVSATAKGETRDREGVISVDGQAIRYSSPASMGGTGSGASPETLLISAVTACYNLTLLAYLQKRKLPCTGIMVKTQGVVTGFPLHSIYARVVVNPVFQGGSASRRDEYQAVAVDARDNCFIGQTVARSGASYEVGPVSFE